MKKEEYKIKWKKIDKKGNYIILYFPLPCNLIIGKIVAKSKISGVNDALESDLFLFSSKEEMFEFFEKNF
jgi:hypothetical protein